MGVAVVSREAAQRATKRAVEASGLTRKDFAARAGITVDTLADFIDGKRWSHGPKRNAIERALGWPLGRIAELAETPPPDRSAKPGPEASPADRPDVRPTDDDAGYVEDRGTDDRPPGITDTELLEEIRQVRREVDERFDDLERRVRGRSLDGAE